MTDTLKKISHLQAAIRQLAADGRIKTATKNRIITQVFYPQAAEEIREETQVKA